MTTQTATVADPHEQWHTVYPTPAFDTPRISAGELAELIKSSKTPGVDYIVVDVRRTDFEGTYIKGAINFPAHSFYLTVSSIATILSRIPVIVFHCNSCKETGRGPRTAGWYRAELERRGIEQGKVLILDGGIKGFSKLYENDAELVSKV